MTRRHGGKGMKNAKDPLIKGAEDVQNNSVFGRYSEAELIARLKGIALDPCRPQFARDNIRPLCNEILRIRKAMVLKDSEIPWRKRKIEQLFKDKPRAPGSVLRNQHNSTKVGKRLISNASSVSCLLNSVDSTQFHDEETIFNSHTSSILSVDNALPDKQVSTECSSLDNIEHSNCPSEDIYRGLDTDESVYGSNPISPEKLNPNEGPSIEISDPIPRLNSPMSNGARRRHRGPPKQSIGLPNYIGDDLQRKVIPVGPRFQADVPDWGGTVRKSNLLLAYKNDSDNTKWLGSQVWPIGLKNMKITERTIGKGRPNSCSCIPPGSVDCIKRHTSERRLLLKCDLGPAFFTWKFDEMGEQVSKLWLLKDRKTFESLVKMKPSSDGRDFVNRVLKRIPNKCRKDIVNYYFNVYIPHRLSVQTRSPSIKQVNTDDEDELPDCRYLGMKKSSERGRLKVCTSKDGKCYLRS